MTLFHVVRQTHKLYPLINTVNVGQSTSFHCEGSSYHEWYYVKCEPENNTRAIIIEEPTPINFNEKLYIINATIVDSGSYVCLGSLSNIGYFVAIASLTVYGKAYLNALFV